MLQIVTAGNGISDIALGVESKVTRTGLFFQLYIIWKIHKWEWEELISAVYCGFKHMLGLELAELGKILKNLSWSNIKIF